MIELTLTLIVLGFWAGMAIGLTFVFVILSMWRDGWWLR